MNTCRGAFRPVVVLAFALGLAMTFSHGCSYPKDRGQDALEMFDIGLTFSEKPSLSLYACGVSLVGIGGGSVDGYFAGLGGNQFGVTRHYHRDVGLGLWTYNEIGWGDKVDPQDPSTISHSNNGIFGWIAKPKRLPPYGLSCVHYLHLGMAGLVLNVRYSETLDFLLGFTTYDFCGDDSDGAGDWPWRRDAPRTEPVYPEDFPDFVPAPKDGAKPAEGTEPTGSSDATNG